MKQWRVIILGMGFFVLVTGLSGCGKSDAQSYVGMIQKDMNTMWAVRHALNKDIDGIHNNTVTVDQFDRDLTKWIPEINQVHSDLKNMQNVPGKLSDAHRLLLDSLSDFSSVLVNDQKGIENNDASLVNTGNTFLHKSDDELQNGVTAIEKAGGDVTSIDGNTK